MADSIRRAEVRGYNITEQQVASYMPDNYRVVATGTDTEGDYVLVEGTDRLGWTLDDYVIPRLRSGNFAASEVYHEPEEPYPGAWV